MFWFAVKTTMFHFSEICMLLLRIEVHREAVGQVCRGALMMPCHGNTFCIIDLLWEETTDDSMLLALYEGHLLQRASYPDRLCFPWCDNCWWKQCFLVPCDKAFGVNKLLNKWFSFQWFGTPWWTCDITVIPLMWIRLSWSFSAMFSDVNSLTPVICKNVISKCMLLINFMGSPFKIALGWMSQNTFDISIGSGNGLVPSGTKPLPDPMLTQIFATIWPH